MGLSIFYHIHPNFVDQPTDEKKVRKESLKHIIRMSKQSGIKTFSVFKGKCKRL